MGLNTKGQLVNNINHSLIKACAQNKREAQQELYSILLPYLNVISKRYLINDSNIHDALQNAFIAIFSNISNYDHKRASLKTWVTKITINECLRINKKFTLEDFESESAPSNYSEEPKVIEKMNLDELILWLKNMPSIYFQVFNLFVIEGFGYDEITELLNINNSTARKRLSRARKWIQENSIDSDILIN